MKYYVFYTKIVDGAIHRNVVGNKINKDMRYCAYFIDHKMPESLYSEDQIIERLYNNPMTKLQAARYLNYLKNSHKIKDNECSIHEYPDNISKSQFSAFIRW